MRLSKEIKALSVLLVLGALVAIDLGEFAQAQPPQERLMARSSRRRLNFRVGVRPSRRRVGGFSRAATCGNQQLLTALVPPPQSQDKAAENQATVDKTATDYPTFFVHVPSLPATTAQFTLQNEAGTKQLHSVRFDLKGKAGIVGIALPKTAPALQVGQKYVWQVSVACDPDDSASNIVVSSWVERVQAPTLGSDPVATLASEGIWQDAVTLLAVQRYATPNDPAVKEDWAALMEDGGLPQFKEAEILQIVKK